MTSIQSSKIAVIYNSNSATATKSQAVADYYVTARGLNPSYVNGFDLGTSNVVGQPLDTDRDAFRAGVMTDIATWLAGIDVDAVILSICCPQFYAYLPETSPTYPLQKWCSFARAIGQVERLLASSSDEHAISPWGTQYVNINFGGIIYSIYVLLNASSQPALSWTTVDPFSGLYPFRFCGHLGLPTGAPANDSQSLAERCIDDAVWYEQNGNPVTSPMLFGMSNRVRPLEHGNVWLGWKKAVRAGMINIETYDGDWGDNAGSKWESLVANGYPLPEITIPDQSTWLQGGGPVKDIWGWVGTGQEQYQGSNPPIPANAYLPSVNFQRGSWMFESTSSAVSKHSLGAGACAAIIPLTEPMSTGLPEISGLMTYLLRGFSIDEAVAMSCHYTYSWVTVSIGDPLYTPFKQLNFGEANSGL